MLVPWDSFFLNFRRDGTSSWDEVPGDNRAPLNYALRWDIILKLSMARNQRFPHNIGFVRPTG